MKSRIISLLSQPSEQLAELDTSFAKAKFILKSVIEDETLKSIFINFNKMDVRNMYNSGD